MTWALSPLLLMAQRARLASVAEAFLVDSLAEVCFSWACPTTHPECYLLQHRLPAKTRKAETRGKALATMLLQLPEEAGEEQASHES